MGNSDAKSLNDDLLECFNTQINAAHKAIDVHPERSIIEVLYRLKDEGKDHFAHAELAKKCATFGGKEYPEGTKVLITVVSRFGDVGFRDYDLDRLEHGYNARAPFDYLKNIKPVSR